MDRVQSNSRDLPLDFVKGILVIVMVIYHTMNYFSTASPEALGYVRFVTGSFIFISGYIIARFYEDKYRRDGAGTAIRLIVRGLKLLFIFTVLNVVINLIGVGNINKGQIDLHHFINNITTIYTSGNARCVSFIILLPISYILMVSPVFLFLKFHNALLATLALLSAFVLSWVNMDCNNINLGIIGLLGLSAGMAINSLNKSLLMHNKAIILCYIIICLFSMGYLSKHVITYWLGIILILKLFYDLAKNISLNTRLSQYIISLGQYSLACYIMQIILLQILARLLVHQKWGFGYQIIAICSVINITLISLSLLIRMCQDRYKLIDRSYKLIFS